MPPAGGPEALSSGPGPRLPEVLSALARVALMNALQYRASFFVDFFVGSGNVVAILLPLAVVFGKTDSVAGWTWDQSLLVTGFFLMMSAVMGGLVEPNLGAVVEGIRQGQMDYILLKPVDAQLVASAQRVAPAKLWDGLSALVVIAWGLHGTGWPGFGPITAAFCLMIAGVMAMYSLWLLVICLSFWFVRVDNLRYLLGAVADAGRWPVDIYSGVARVFLTVVVPVALASSWPAMALLGRLDLALVVQAIAVSLGGFAFARWSWKRALASYTSASS